MTRDLRVTLNTIIMTAIKIVFIVLGSLGLVGVLVDAFDVLNGVQPEGVLTHVILSAVGLSGYVVTVRTIKKKGPNAN